MFNIQVHFSRFEERFFSLKPLAEACFLQSKNFLSNNVKDYYDICLNGENFMREAA
jgi:hypothetical protein